MKNFQEGQIFGNYRLIELIGKGGFASVWRCEHIHLGVKVAIKFLSDMDSFGRVSFLQEAKIIATLRHPNIVRLLDYSVQDNQAYLVMEYALGSLGQRQSTQELLDLATVVSYVKQMAAALQYAHKQNIIHRDVKPQNMLISESGNILLSDFGIAIASANTSESGELNTGSMVGTAHFIAPEQILGKPRRASDQYSLAICAYFWLCGTYPFQGSISALIAQHMHTPPRPPLEFNPALPSSVGDVLLKALAKKPEDRFSSVEDFAKSLELACSGQGIIPQVPATTPYQATGIATHYYSRSTNIGPINVSIIPTSASLNATKPVQVSTISAPARQHSNLGLRFFTYLLVMPLLILLTPFLLLYHYSMQIWRSTRRAHRPNPIQPGRVIAILELLPLPQNFWPARLLSGKAASLAPPLPGDAIQNSSRLASVPLLASGQHNASWAKAAWMHTASFLTKGPPSLSTLADQSTLVQTLPGKDGFLDESLQNPDAQPPELASVDKQAPPIYHSPESLQPEERPDRWSRASARKNFCILHHDKDRSWAEWIAWLLEDDGLSSILPEWDFRPGYRVDRETRNAMSQAERIIVIISPDYLDVSNDQWGIVFNRERVRREGMILPIIVRECNSPLKKPLDTLVSINLVGRGVFHTSEKLLKAVRLNRSKPTLAPAFPLPNQDDSSLATRKLDRADNQQDTPPRGLDIISSSNPKVTTTPTERFDTGISSPQIIEQIKTAFSQEDWLDVIRKVRLLIQDSTPTGISWQIYRMQALAYHSLGQMAEAHGALEAALAMVNDKKERLALLDEYTNKLASLKHWSEMLPYAKEALTLAPEDIRWQVLHEHITTHLQREAFGLERSQGFDQALQQSDDKQNHQKTSAEHIISFHTQFSNPEDMKTMIISDKTINIFIAYALDDKELCTRLKHQLIPLANQSPLIIWYDHEIVPGKERVKIMEKRLTSSQIVILSISAAFLASEYHQREMRLALERYEANTASIIPVLLRPSDWEKTSLGNFQPLPQSGLPVTTWPNTDEALLDIVKGIRQAVEELQNTL